MTNKEAWDKVNKAESFDELQDARIALADDRELSNEQYNELMRALSSKFCHFYASQRFTK